jgi:hypothetical protein
MCGVRRYLVGCVLMLALAGCGRGIMQYAQREPWREQAEMACLKSGTVREGPTMVRIAPIQGPGVCGANHPIKVAAFAVGNAFGFAQEPVRPPGGIADGPRWPVAASQSPQLAPPLQQPRYVPSGEPRMLAVPPDAGGYQSPPPRTVSPPPAAYPSPAASTNRYPPPQRHATPGPPLSISPPGIDPYMSAPPPVSYPSPQRAPGGMVEPEYDEYDRRGVQTRPAAVPPPAARPLPALGPRRDPRVTASVPVEVKPAATLACPIVSALDRWIATSVQPAAYKWFGQPVAEIRQISAYSCRGMNGQPGARISEHAFGNALDIAAFVLADGKRITIKKSWHATPEEQGFLRDVQGAACEQFTTVLAPGSNKYHYDHIHVDLMRRKSGRRICQPGAIDGEVVAARVRKSRGMLAQRPIEPPPTRRYDPPFDSRNDPFAWRGDSVRRSDPSTTGSIAGKTDDTTVEDMDWIEDPSPRPEIDWTADRHKVY